MKRTLTTLTVLFMALCINAQVVSFDMINRNRNINVRLTLQDSKTSEPISWASVYLIPQGDTTITHFALSDDKGDIELKDVPVGKYELNAEMIGYLPHKKTYTFKNWSEDLGIIKMEENPEYLEAAKVSAAGNAIMIKQDTIIYNASSFKVGENDMLADLLKKMPGVEVGSDGSVTVNGEKVEKITVGGKTFFFNDPTAALSNLPAKLVDKIKVVDKDKDEAAFSGIATKDDKEKVMDVELKEEYTKGWFGNAKAGGGTTLTPKTENSLIDDRMALYNGNVMASGYTEKDQVVFIANAFNATEPGSQTVMVYSGMEDEDSDFLAMEGINSSAQAGINYSTDRIKGFEATTSVNYKNNAKDAASRSARTSFQNEGPDLHTDQTYDGFGNENSVSVNMELKNKDTKKYMLYFVPAFKYSGSDVTSSNRSRTYADEELNSSTSNISSHYNTLTTSGWFNAGIKDLGKEKRSLTFDLSYQFSDAAGKRKEISELIQSGISTIKDLHYDNDRKRSFFDATISYVEPLNKNWALQTRISTEYNSGTNDKDAFNPDGSRNDYYTSMSDSRYMSEGGRVLLQFNNDTLNALIGVKAEMVKNEIHARSLGVETVTGKDEWLLNISPFASIRHKKGSSNLRLSYNGYSRQVSGSRISPTLDISNPIQVTAGNIYLRPGFDHYLGTSYSTNNREKFSFLNLSMYGSVTTNGTVQASWFDKSGIRYSVPVNAQKPSGNVSMHVSYNTPIGKDRKLTFSAYSYGSFSTGTNYQATGSHEGLDLQNFDYASFMAGFWGDASGNRFYSGESGFRESRTNSLSWSADMTLKYSLDKIELTAKAVTTNKISRYSLAPSADMNTWSSRVGGGILYTPGKDWEFKSDFRYWFYNGYSDGYGEPECSWNMSISKSIKSVTLSLKADDLLNQRRSLRRTTSAEYMEDVYSNVLGRYFIFSVSFNFGKMNAKKNSRVEDAMWRGLW